MQRNIASHHIDAIVPQFLGNLQAGGPVGLSMLQSGFVLVLGEVGAQAVDAGHRDAQLAGHVADSLVEAGLPGRAGGEQELLGQVELLQQVCRDAERAVAPALAMQM